MREFEKYFEMCSLGKTPDEVYRSAKADSVDEITCIRLLRQVFNLSLVEAKSVIVESSGQASSLDEYQGKLKSGIEQAIDTDTAILFEN